MFYDLRGNERSDKLPDKYVQLAVSVWEQVTRPSERKKDQLKPPFQKDGPLHAVHWLEMRIAEVHAAILEKGKETFGDEFHFSYGFTFAVKPWFVKKVERDLCLCIYHLEFDLFVKKLYSFLKYLRANHYCQCDFPSFHSLHDFRNAAMCPKPPGSEFYQEACASKTCLNART